MKTLIKTIKTPYNYLVVAVLFGAIFLFRSYHESQQMADAILFNTSIPFGNGVLLFIATSILVALLIIGLIIDQTKSPEPIFTYIDLAFLINILWMSLSWFWAEGKGNAAHSLSINFCIFFCYLLFRYLTVEKIHKKKWFQLAFFFLGIYVVADFFIQYDHLFELFSDGSNNYQKTIKATRSLIGPKNQTGWWLALYLFVLLYFRESKVPKFIYYITIALITFHMIFMGSRNAYVAVIGMLISLYLFSGKDKLDFKKLIYFSLPVLAFFLLVDTDLIWEHLKYNTLDSRIVIWKKAEALVSAAPLFGNGPGQYLNLKDSVGLVKAIQPHNSYLLTMIEYGIVGFLLYFGFIQIFLSKSYQLIKNKELDFESKKPLVPLAAVIIGMLLLYLLDGLRDKINHQVLFMFVLALIHLRLAKLKNIGFLPKKYNVMLLGLVFVYAIALIFYGVKFEKERRFARKTYTELERKKSYLEAIESYKLINRNLVEQIGGYPIDSRIANCYLRAKEYDKAVESASKSLNVYPSNFNSRMIMAKAFINLKDYDSATFQIKEIQKMRPHYKEVLKLVDLVIEKAEDKKELEQILEKYEIDNKR